MAAFFGISLFGTIVGAFVAISQPSSDEIKNEIAAAQCWQRQVEKKLEEQAGIVSPTTQQLWAELARAKKLEIEQIERLEKITGARYLR
jgi:hypothetical protein